MYERRGVLRQQGQRISRHYCDLHCLMPTETGKSAVSNLDLASDCVAHARMFFDRPDYDLVSAEPGSFAIAPVAGMVDALRGDCARTEAMIFGAAPSFEDILVSLAALDAAVNKR